MTTTAKSDPSVALQTRGSAGSGSSLTSIDLGKLSDLAKNPEDFTIVPSEVAPLIIGAFRPNVTFQALITEVITPALEGEIKNPKSVYTYLQQNPQVIIDTFFKFLTIAKKADTLLSAQRDKGETQVAQ